MAATVIRNFIAKKLFQKKGAIANNKAVEFSANALEQRLINLGIDPNQAINYNESSDTTEAVYRSVARVASSQRSNPDGNVSFTLPERQASQPQEPVDDHLPPPIIRSHRISRVRAED